MQISTHDLVKSYRQKGGRKRVVDGVSFTLDQGQVVGLLGPNGAGKTTTFYMVVGLVRPDSGKVKLDGKEITRLPMFRRARLGIGYLAQESSVFRRLTVADNIRLVMESNGYNRRAIKDRIDQLTEQLHLDNFLHKRGGVLSGGERRRCEIARALSTEPAFILLDEPFTGIDPVTIEELQGIIRRLAKTGIGILITDHNVEATLNITDHNYILVDSHIMAEGDETAIRSNETVRKFYLGEGFQRPHDDTIEYQPEDSGD
ncbi:MAG: LPS export ABC transporter ATP-binding protein [Fimbriimonadaceae bacterium]|nr:LPS export ABC transporter ATP-binding protein [Fimbriimonadaceae bacterium]